MPSIDGRENGKEFRSAGGRGIWIPCNSVANPAVGNIVSLQVPKNLSGDFKTRDWNGTVPAVGILVQGTNTPDAGVSTLKATKHQILRHVDMMVLNKYLNPYMQTREDLAAMAYVGMNVNPVAEYLDQHFNADGARPVEGITPRAWFSPDVGVAGTTAKPLLSENHGNYGSTDPFDCYFRQLEGQLTIRSAAPALQTWSYMQSVPLCVWTGSLVRDAIPLDTLCDLDRPWEVSVRVVRDPNTGLSPGNGSITITAITLYLYAIPVRDIDPRTHGLPYIIRHQNRGQSPLQYNAGEVVSFSGNMPLTQDNTRVDTVDGVDYQPGISFGDFSGDLQSGNVIEWQIGSDKPRFPYWFQDRNPSNVYRSITNMRESFHKTRFGASTDVVVRAGRALAGLGYAPVVDAGVLSTLLGAVSPWPARVVAMSALDVKGFPGFGSLKTGCGAPFITMNGNQNFTGSLSAINSPSGMVDVIVNNTREDARLIEDLGSNCCRDGTITFASVAENPDSTKAELIAGKLTTAEQVMPKVATGTAALASASTAPVVAVAGK